MIIRFGCNKVLNREFVGWANLLKEHLFDFSDFLRAFIFDRKHLTLTSKLKSLVSFVKNVVFYKNLKMKIWMFCICLLFSWQLLRYMIIYWIYEQTVSEYMNRHSLTMSNIWVDGQIYEQTVSENFKYMNRHSLKMSNIRTDGQIYEQTVSENFKYMNRQSLKMSNVSGQKQQQKHEKCRRFCQETSGAVTITKA